MREENINTVIHCPSRDHLLTLLCRQILGADPVFEEDEKEQKTMTTETNRREFEEWITSLIRIMDTMRDREGNYYDDFTEIAWEAWQAAREWQWRPIETAPKDGTWMIVYLETVGQSICAYYSPLSGKLVDTWCGSIDKRCYKPTHWQPLPAPPNPPTSEKV